ncbi:MAG TPA: signal peptidase I, partial [Kouleothrix sp.]|nr:signal peptidase I [Kouleothrix sp.]
MLALLAVAWAALAPPSLGGRATFVIVNGNSMEPTLHRGDLVIVRAAASYQAGDIVTYRHPQIGPVIHRIIRRDGDRYIFKGDHNHWTDSYAPAQAELIGRLWLYLPSAGKPIGWLRKPLGMALMAALLGSVLMFNLNRDQARRHQRLLRYAEELRAQQPPQPYR